MVRLQLIEHIALKCYRILVSIPLWFDYNLLMLKLVLEAQ